MKTRFVSLVLSCFLGFILLGLLIYVCIEYYDARIVVEWSTASEFDTVGYNIYRSDSPTDLGILVNVDLIPASEDAQTGGDYSFIDSDVVPGRVYYYYLEDISANGTTNRHGPIEIKAQTIGKMVRALMIALVVVILFGIAVLTFSRRKTG